jgi:hypothetical protein
VEINEKLNILGSLPSPGNEKITGLITTPVLQLFEKAVLTAFCHKSLAVLLITNVLYI